MFLESGMWIDERLFSGELLLSFHRLIRLMGPDLVLSLLNDYIELWELDSIGGDSFVS